MVRGMTEIIVLGEEVIMGGLLVLYIAGDQVLTMVELAAQSMIGTMAQLMIDTEVLIMVGLEALGMADIAGACYSMIKRFFFLILFFFFSSA